MPHGETGAQQTSQATSAGVVPKKGYLGRQHGALARVQSALTLAALP